MNTLGDLKSRIASDIGRSDLATEIAEAVTQAYDEVKHREFFFNQTRDFTFSTVADQYQYGSSVTDTINGESIALTDFWNIRQVWLDVSNRRRHLDFVTYEAMEHRIDGSQASGEPYDWSWFSEEMWLYPVPNIVYTVRVAGHYNLPLPSNDTNTNDWITHAGQYLRESAKEILYQTRINSPDRLKLAVAGKTKTLTILKNKTFRKAQRTTITGSEMC
jgi:hypothetical protein